MSKFIRASYNEKTLTVEYIADNGDRLLRSGGTIAWRFNNPGNLRPGSKYTLHIGQGHTLNGTFLIFPTPEAGRAEKKALLLRKYRDDSISGMLYTYAPPRENDTEAYIRSVCGKTGLSREQTVGHLSDPDLKSLMTAMEEHEGYHHKKETRKEIWVYTTVATFSDGARPLPNVPVKIKRHDEETIVGTNAFGQLPPLIHRQLGETVELWVESVNKEWQKLESLVLGEVSQAFLFVRNALVVSGITARHNPSLKDVRKPHSFRYVVQPGDSLSKIATKFSVEISKIQKDNGIKNPHHLMAGEVLVIQRSQAVGVVGDQPAALPRKHETSLVRLAKLERSKEGKGHPLAMIQVDQKRAPWMEYALAEAKRWAGKKEDEITKESNYHRIVNPRGGLRACLRIRESRSEMAI